jgi:POT family proton-dependent oligopeptide transporter
MTHQNSPAATADRSFFGHPRGLATLFFTEMWERFSFYGMRALLILFMTAEVTRGGLSYSVATAGAVYALYTSLVYLVGLPGGWIADRFIGQRRAVFWGGVAIAAGQFTLAIPHTAAFYPGLALIILGTGLLKPNVSAIVGQLYEEGDERRDAGFSIFYMGINIGAFAAPLICGFIGEKIDWHLGFGIAGIGMCLGLVQYVLGGRHLGDAGLHPVVPEDPVVLATQRRRLRIGLVSLAVAGLAVIALAAAGVIHLTPEGVADSFGVVLLMITVGFFAWLLLGVSWTPVERKRLVAILVLFMAASFFWGAYEQAGSSLNLFARDVTDRQLFGYEFPASWFQWVPALFVILQAPLFAWLWVRLGDRQPSSPVKFSLGLVFVGLGFVVMVAAAWFGIGGAKVGPGWLLTTYFLHVVGEMCLSPVGLSTVTKLAPARVAGLMMGVWFLAAAVGNYIGGRVAGLYEAMPLWQLFGIVASTTIAAGLVLAALSRPIRRLMGGVR